MAILLLTAMGSVHDESPNQRGRDEKDHVMCDFCRHDEYGHHHQHCVRDEPNARAEYDRGWLDGRRGRDCASHHPAYVVGWNRGDSAYDEWFNGGYGE